MSKVLHNIIHAHIQQFKHLQVSETMAVDVEHGMTPIFG